MFAFPLSPANAMNIEHVINGKNQPKVDSISLILLLRRITKSLLRVKKQFQSTKHRTNNSIAVIENKDMLCVEISSEKINQLLRQRLICAADIRCLDQNSKQCLKKLCLSTCLYLSPLCNPASRLLDNKKI